MPDATALVLYESKHGQTAKIAARIADVVREHGVDVTLRRAADAIHEPPGGFDGVLLAGSVHGGRHQHEIVEYARVHHTALSACPSAFVSVSLTAADDTEESAAATRDLIDDVLDDTGWTPDAVLPVAGALQYEEYDFVTRLVMRLVASQHDATPDATHDQEFTDWAALDRFAADFAARVTEHLPAI